MEPTLLLQPVTKSISQEQLRVELRSIYSGLVMVENKCKDVDREQTRLAIEGNPNCRPGLSAKQWQALIALHKTLLHEFHDFFLASQHPAATPNLTKLAARNSMPARLWQFGIHNFLEVLRYRLPESLDYMLAFIYTAYSMMTLLYETVPAFADTWIECLGDLGRYRMAVEDDDRRDRETWSGVSRYWYKKAWDKKPETGRLAHHLAILSPPFTFEQLSLYLRSLTSIIPFESAKTSILTVLTPVIEGKQDPSPTSSYIEILLIKLLAIMFTLQQKTTFAEVLHKWKIELIRYIHRSGSTFKAQGVLIMICTAAGLYECGRSKPGNIPLSIIRRTQESRRTEESRRVADLAQFGAEAMTTATTSSSPSPPSSPQASELEPLSEEDFKISSQNVKLASSVAFVTFSIVLQFSDDVNVYATIHEYFVMVSEFVKYTEIMALIQADVPWTRMAIFLNTVITLTQHTINLDDTSNAFPHSPNVDRPLPEDYVRQGLLYGWNYVTPAYLDQAGIDQDEQEIEAPSMATLRKQRLLHLGRKIAVRFTLFLISETNCNAHLLQESRYLEYLTELCSFQATEFAKRLTKRDILDVPNIHDIITESDSDMSVGHDAEDVRMHTPESPPQLPATLSPLPQTEKSSGRAPASMPIDPPRISPSIPSGQSVRPESTLFQARTMPAKHIHPYNPDVVIADNYDEHDTPYIKSP